MAAHARSPPSSAASSSSPSRLHAPISTSASTRERLLIDTEVPRSVYALDLRKLSELSEISEADLVRGMQSEDAVDMQAVVVERGQDISFEAVGKPPEDILLSPPSKPSSSSHRRRSLSAPPVVKEVLITAASSTMCLADSDTPKCLLELGEYTLLEHILAQLFVAGMERVVIIISHFGAEIIAHVKDSVLYHKMQIEFVNLGEDTPYGHARTLLAAREMFDGPFLIHTADHVFDKAILQRMANFDLEDCVACVLVDRDEGKRKGLPSTAGKVQLGSGSSIHRIGRNVKRFDAIDAGLFLTTGRIFAALEMLAYEKPKFSLAEALNVLRPSYGLKYLETAGDMWISIETQEQLDQVIANDYISQLAPWPVVVAKDVAASAEQQEAIASGGRNVFVAVSSADDDSLLRVVDVDERTHQVLEGFVVGVNQLEQVPAERSEDEHTPLLPVSSSPQRQLQSLSPCAKVIRKKNSFLENAEESFVLSIPFEPPTATGTGKRTEAVTPLAGERNAYLIELPESTTGEFQQFFLAVPENEVAPEGRDMMQQLFTLPSDVDEVLVETLELKTRVLELQLVVKRMVPLLGFALLLGAVVARSSTGIVLGLQANVDPFLKTFWFSSASFLMFIPLTAFVIWLHGPPSVPKTMLWPVLMCCVGYAVFLMTFVWSLNHTSFGHAFIFNNSHAVLLLLARLLMGSALSRLQVVAVVLAIAGAIATTLDHSVTAISDTPVHVSVQGDLVALVGAIGGAVFLFSAKRVREKIPPVVLLLGVMLFTIVLNVFVLLAFGIPYKWSTDAALGLFGWLDDTQVVTVVFLVLVGMIVGTLGYVGILKYFDPIVVSVTMLAELVFASGFGLLVELNTALHGFALLGAVLIIFGVVTMIWASRKRTDSVNATAAMAKTSATLPRTDLTGTTL